MTNGSEADTVASDKERHPMTLKLFHVLWKALGLVFLSIKVLEVSLLSFSFLTEKYTIDNYRRLIRPRQDSICNTAFVMHTHTSSPFSKYFVLSTLDS